jgi:hypothetical protein
VNIHATGETSFGPIDETFSPALNGTITGNVLSWAQNSTGSKTGAINQTTTIDNKFLGLAVPTALIIFSMLSIIFMILLVVTAISYSKFRRETVSSFDRQIQKIQKSYGSRIAESIGDSSVNDKNPIPMNSIEDLMKIADELGKPVVHQCDGSSGDVHLYYVIDGNTRYQYSISRD